MGFTHSFTDPVRRIARAEGRPGFSGAAFGVFAGLRSIAFLFPEN
jgi:hypothetical protein